MGATLMHARSQNPSLDHGDRIRFLHTPGGQLSRGATAIRAGHALAKAVEPGLANLTFIFATVFCDPLSTLSDRDTDLQAVG